MVVNGSLMHLHYTTGTRASFSAECVGFLNTLWTSDFCCLKKLKLYINILLGITQKSCTVHLVVCEVGLRNPACAQSFIGLHCNVFHIGKYSITHKDEVNKYMHKTKENVFTKDFRSFQTLGSQCILESSWLSLYRLYTPGFGQFILIFLTDPLKLHLPFGCTSHSQKLVLKPFHCCLDLLLIDRVLLSFQLPQSL